MIERIPFAPLAPREAWAVAEAQGWGGEDQARWSALGEGSLRWLEEAAFRRAEAELVALADELGSVREIVSRLLRSFEQRGWVKLGRERVTVLDPRGLSALVAERS